MCKYVSAWNILTLNLLHNDLFLWSIASIQLAYALFSVVFEVDEHVLVFLLLLSSSDLLVLWGYLLGKGLVVLVTTQLIADVW